MVCRDTHTHEWVCGWLGGSVGQWVGSGQMTKNLINLDLIEIIQFCLMIYDLLGGCMDQWVGSGQMTNLIKCKVIRVKYAYNHIQVRPAYNKQR